MRNLLLSTFCDSSIDYYLVCSLTIHKICALCGIHVFSAISVLLTMVNSDDLEIRLPDGSRSFKVTPVNFTCVISYQSLIVPEAISCTVHDIQPSTGPKLLYFALLLLRLTHLVDGFPWDDLRKILHGGQRMDKAHSGEEISGSFNPLSKVHQRYRQTADDRQTDVRLQSPERNVVTFW